MHTMGPWKVGKQVGDTWCVVTTNPINGRPPSGDDIERYGGTPIARGLTQENARLVAVAPEMFKVVQGLAMRAASEDDAAAQAIERVFTGMP